MSKKILVNPSKCVGRTIYLNKVKFPSPPMSVIGSADRVHYNPKFFSAIDPTVPRQPIENILTLQPPGSVIHVNRHFLTASASTSASTSSKYKYLKSEATEPAIPNHRISSNFQIISKYQCISKSLTRSREAAVSSDALPKPNYQLKRHILRSPHSKKFVRTPEKVRSLKRLSSDFKRVGRNKIVRKSIYLQSKLKNNGSSKRRSLITHYKIIRNPSTPKLKLKPTASVGSKTPGNTFTVLSKTLLVRKSVLQQKIEARRQAKDTWRRILKNDRHHYFTPLRIQNKYKFVSTDVRRRIIRDAAGFRTRNILPTKVKKLKKTCKTIQKVNKLKKNNQRCLFYNRFGRCKGKEKGTCSKIHDPLYISICKKLLSGNCTDKDCLLSHDIRPGKMPTCHHYLAGLCTRSDCPFLHIKVNPKAAVCSSFLLGYCPDVYSCMKRHEFICPVFASKGICPRGKSCVYPHRIPAEPRTKLLTDDQKPLIKSSRPRNKEEDRTLPGASPVTLPSQSNDRQSAPDHVVKSFTRYFAFPLPLDSVSEREDEIPENLS